MAANPERPDTIGVDELKSLETSVLKTLCLTINTAGSELKYKILDSLSDDDFYFPVLRALFSTLAEMHRRGDYVISANLEEELHKSEAEVPAGFSIEQLFDGSLPSLTDLNGWVSRLKERSRSGMIPSVRPPDQESAAPVPSKAEQTVVKPLAEVKKRIADEARKSNPAVAEAKPLAPPSSPVVAPPPSSPSIADSRPRAPVTPVERAPLASVAPVTAAPKSQPPAAPPAKEKSSPAVPPPKRSQKAVLSSEADDWSSYLEGLAGESVRFDTGFARLDEQLGGLSPGLMLLIDEDRDRVVSFLKQVTDQVASSTPGHCLFLAAEIPKSALRLRTISRLAGVPLADLEKGRVKRDSPEWRRVDGAGRGAQDWLRRVFVYEVEGEIEISLVRELVKKLLEASEDKKCLVVVDTLEKIARPSGAGGVVSLLKGLADSLEVLIVAAAVDPTLLASKDTDYAAVFRNVPQGLVELEVLRAGKENSTVVRFRYDPETCGFTEA
jgi:hypothetical protein